MKKIAILLVLFVLFGLGAGVFAKDVLFQESDSLINDEAVPLSSSRGQYADTRVSLASQVGPTMNAQNEGDDINVEWIRQGIVSVKYNNEAGKKIKVSLKKGDEQVYYNYLKSGEYEVFPLVFGNGTYQVTLLENTEGNQYRVIKQVHAIVDLDDENLPFLQSVQPIRWSLEDRSTTLAEELTAGLETEREKFMALYTYVVKNIQYDAAKIKGLDHTYVPVNNDTLETQKGICYDYAALLASMLRSQGIPTQLVKGYGDFQPDVYHAWNQVLLDGQWILVDPSYDAQQLNRGREVNVVKEAEAYKVVQNY